MNPLPQNAMDNKTKKNMFFKGRYVDKKILDNLVITEEYQYYVSKNSVTERMLYLLMIDMGLKYEDLKKMVITDITSGLGGDIFTLARYFKKVNGFEINKDVFPILKHNVCEVMKLKNVKLINKDYVKAMDEVEQDVVFFDPPWLDFKDKEGRRKKNFRLKFGGMELEKFVSGLGKFNRTKYVCMKLPVNYDIDALKQIKYDSMSLYKLDKKRVLYVIVAF